MFMRAIFELVGFVLWVVCYLLFFIDVLMLHSRPGMANSERPLWVMAVILLAAFCVLWCLGGSHAMFLWLPAALVLMPAALVRCLKAGVADTRMPIRSRLWLPILTLGFLAIDPDLARVRGPLAQALYSLDWRRDERTWSEVWQWLPKALAALMMAWLCADALLFIWRQRRPLGTTKTAEDGTTE